MAEFSYADDIAPMRGDFFNTGPLSSRESQAIQKQYGPEITELQNNIAKMEGERFRMRAADLAYERSMFEFDHAKEKSKREREEIEQLGGLSETLQGIVDDPNRTPFEKSQELNRMRMRNPLRGAATSSLFSGAFSAVDAQAKQAKPSGLLYSLAQTGEVGITRRIAERDGVVTPEESDFISWAEQNKARAIEREKQAGIGAREKQGEAARKAEGSYLDKILGDIGRITPKTSVEPPADAKDSWAESIRDGKIDPPKTYSPTQIDQLKAKARLVVENPAVLREILKQDDGALIKHTLEDIIRREQKSLLEFETGPPRKSAGDPYLK